MAVWASSLSMDPCPECCGGTGSCPCDQLALTPLSALLSVLSGTCPDLDGLSGTWTYDSDGMGGHSWNCSLSGPGFCNPQSVDFSCVDVGGGVYKFQLFIVFNADLSASGYADVVSCDPKDIEFNMSLLWSGSNGDLLCCPQTDTGVPTVIGTIKVVLS